MGTPNWLRGMLGWKPATEKSRARCIRLFGQPIAPNLADVGNVESLRLAGYAYRTLDIIRRTATTLSDDTSASESSSGTALERHIERDVAAGLNVFAPYRGWAVTRAGGVSRYAQFKHLGELQRLFEEQPALRAALGRDYQVKTDVYVSVPHPEEATALPFLHAAISCKWTIRSDRVQNVRHEFATLVRNRRGRLPHLVLVTAEPLPSRLISIARGTGEVDAVYHLLFDELDEAVRRTGAVDQLDQWAEMVEQDRLRPYSVLASDLVMS
jgi:hypothetical protein